MQIDTYPDRTDANFQTYIPIIFSRKIHLKYKILQNHILTEGAPVTKWDFLPGTCQKTHSDLEHKSLYFAFSLFSLSFHCSKSLRGSGCKSVNVLRLKIGRLDALLALGINFHEFSIFWRLVFTYAELFTLHQELEWDQTHCVLLQWRI